MTCFSCGGYYTETSSGCYVDELCQECTPSAGRCLDCAAMRREELSERTIRYAIENETCS